MTWKSKITFAIILKNILPGRFCNNQKEPKTFFFIIKAVNVFNECPCIYSISNFFRVISTSTKIVYLHDIVSQKNIKPNRNMRLNSSTWKPSHFKAVLQLVPDSMLKFLVLVSDFLLFYICTFFSFFSTYLTLKQLLSIKQQCNESIFEWFLQSK